MREAVLAGGSGGAEVAAAEALLKVHLMTFMAWLITMWIGAQLFMRLAALADGRRVWLGWVLIAGAALATLSAGVTALSGQLTTLSEPLLFRAATFAFTIWMFVASLGLRRASVRVPAAARPA